MMTTQQLVELHQELGAIHRHLGDIRKDNYFLPNATASAITDAQRDLSNAQNTLLEDIGRAAVEEAQRGA